MKESTIERRVCKWAQEHGWLAYKFVSPNQRGVPDRVFVSPRGVVVFVEFKAPGGKPTKLQLHEAGKLLKNQANYFLTNNYEHATAELASYH